MLTNGIEQTLKTIDIFYSIKNQSHTLCTWASSIPSIPLDSTKFGINRHPSYISLLNQGCTVFAFSNGVMPSNWFFCLKTCHRPGLILCRESYACHCLFRSKSHCSAFNCELFTSRKVYTVALNNHGIKTVSPQNHTKTMCHCLFQI